eukprot:gene51657-69127_t
MGATKTDYFTERQNQLAALAKALAHPARIAILDYLLKVDACVCGDIVNELPLAQPTVSQHLKELKAAGLIKGSIEGNKVGLITKRFIDCGNTVRNETVVSMQLWDANDYDHRLAPEKLLKIIASSERILGIEDHE